jgi:hypothetical protein
MFLRPDKPVRKTSNDPIFEQIFSNSMLFLKKAIAELIDSGERDLLNDQAVLVTLYTQLSAELAMKAYLISEGEIKTVLRANLSNKSDAELQALFGENNLLTRSFQELKEHLRDNHQLVFDSKDIAHLDTFQLYRNKIVHFNLYLEEPELRDLKFQAIYIIVHVVAKFLSQIDLLFDTPSDFYRECLPDTLFKDLIKYRPYKNEMCKIAKAYTGFNYECPECFTRAYSPSNDLCYCCGLDFTDQAEYVNCNVCNAKNAVIFDGMNIEYNENQMFGRCMNCDNKCDVFKCPNCGSKKAFHFKEELADTCFSGCLHA